MKALKELDRSIKALEYKKQLLEWMISKPKKRKSYTLSEIRREAGIERAGMKPFKNAVIGLYVVETEDALFRLPPHDIVEEMVVEYNNHQMKKAQIFGDSAPPILIKKPSKKVKDEDED